MADSRFFSCKGPYNAQQLADMAGAKLIGDPNIEITDVAAIGEAGSHHVSFLDNRKYIKDFEQSSAGLCLVHPDLADRAPDGMALLVTEEPYMGYAKISNAFYPLEYPESDISDRAFVHETAKIGTGVCIEANAYIGENVTIGDGSWIKANAAIAKGVVIGEKCIISQNVTISHSVLGNAVTIHPGCQIGQDGFGFASSATEGHVRIPQLGRVIIQDHVNIGANTTVDRGAGPDTVIGAGTQIDNLVQLGHNVEIGFGCVIVSHVGISGSTKLGNFVVVGGQVGIAGHLEIGDGVKIAAQSGVMRNAPAGQTLGGSPALPHKEWLRQVAAVSKLTKVKK